MSDTRQMTPQDILRFWFEETTGEQRFKKDDAFDEGVRTRFEDVYWKILRGETTSWRATPEGRLAEIIVLDQFARNMFRGLPQSFEGDQLALRLAEEMVARGDDTKLPREWRGFVYMPYMHSESKEVHEKAVTIFERYGNEEMLEYEKKHKAIIDRFGRYPHRNEILGRESTPEELEFLNEHSGF